MASRKGMSVSWYVVGAILLLALGLYCAHIWRVRKIIPPGRLLFEYDIPPGNATSLPIHIEDGLAQPPRIRDEWNTAILRLRVDHSLISRVATPRLVVSCGPSASSHGFTKDASGTWLVDITSELRCPGNLQFHSSGGLRLDDQQAELLLFHTPLTSKDRILVIAPHPDDAELAAFGLYSTINPDSTFIATISAGDGGEPLQPRRLFPDDSLHQKAKGEIRSWNSVTVPLLGGLPPGHAFNLGYYNEKLPEMFHNPESLIASKGRSLTDIEHYRRFNLDTIFVSKSGSSSWRSLIADLQRIARIVRPTVIVAPYPALDAHPDHKRAFDAVLAAIQDDSVQSFRFLLYTNHHSRTILYPFGKAFWGMDPPPFHKPLYADRILSIPLSEGLVRKKAIAMESMNDLRPFMLGGSMQETALLLGKRLMHPWIFSDVDYFRQNLRSNELFLVVEAQSLKSMDILSRIRGE